jgi:hypothetical protein
MAIPSTRFRDPDAPARAAGSPRHGLSRGPSEGIRAWATFLLDVNDRLTDTHLRRHAGSQTWPRVRHKFVMPACTIAVALALADFNRLMAILS